MDTDTFTTTKNTRSLFTGMTWYVWRMVRITHGVSIYTYGIDPVTPLSSKYLSNT